MEYVVSYYLNKPCARSSGAGKGYAPTALYPNVQFVFGAIPAERLHGARETALAEDRPSDLVSQCSARKVSI